VRANLGKTAIAAPLYVSVAWTLMVSYQFFTQTAVATVITNINMVWPSLGGWLTSRMDMLVFIYAFAWVFVLSSVIPSVLLGKERSVLIQFFVCLTLTFIAFAVQDALTTYGGRSIEQWFSLAVLFYNPFLAVIYLLTPYFLMLTIDIRSRRKRKKEEELENVTTAYVEEVPAPEQKTQEEEASY
jgi:uncharacterized membrane protein